VKHAPSAVQLAVSDVNGCESSFFSAAILSATANHLSYVHVPLEQMHSRDPILGAEEQNALEVAVVLVAVEVVAGDDCDKCLDAMFLQRRKV
jgi:hypothetical protein